MVHSFLYPERRPAISTVNRSLRGLSLAALALVLLAACSPLGQEQAAPPAAVQDEFFEPELAEATPIAGLEIIDIESADHTSGAVTYAQIPPAGGPHDPSWQKCGVYDAPLRNENAVHSLEHGAVWITYQPELPEAERAKLEEIGRGHASLLVSPYPGLEDPIVASAWGAQLRLENADDPRLTEFITVYAGNGPEAGANCNSGIEVTLGG